MKNFSKAVVKMRFVIIAVYIALLLLGLNLMSKVVTNYDLSLYLDQNSETVVALDKMEEEFGSAGNASIMIQDITIETARDLKEQIENIDGVVAVSFDEDNSYKNNNALFKIFLESNNYDVKTFDTVDEIRNELSEHQVSFNGEGIRASYLQKAIKKDLKIILAIVAVVIIIILLLASSSWIDPFLLVLLLGFVVIINLGLNAIFPHISFITRSICIVLQLALSMDYSIIMLHSFKGQRASKCTPKEAAANAIANSFSTIIASSLTTMAGLMALSFMKYKIGFDIGVVLTKGVIVSLVSVIFFMPALLVLFSRAIDISKHKTIGMWFKEKFFKKKKAGRGFSIFQYKSRVIIPIVLFSVIALGMLMNSSLQYEYIGDPAKLETEQINVENKAIEDEFGMQNALVLMVPQGDRAKEQELMDFILNYQLDGQEAFNSGIGLISTGVVDQLTPKEISEEYDVPESLVLDAFEAMGKQPTDTIVLFDLLQYLHDERFAIDTAEDRQKQLDTDKKDAESIFEEYNAAQFAEVLDIDAETAGEIYALMEKEPSDKVVFHEAIYFISKNQVFAANGNEQAQIGADELNTTAQELLGLISKNDAVTDYDLSEERADEIFQSLNTTDRVVLYDFLSYMSDNHVVSDIGTEIQADIDKSYETAVNAIDMFESDDLTRMIFNLNYPISSTEAFSIIKDLRIQIPEYYEDSFMLSESATYLDIRDLFQIDTIQINLISFFAIFIIIMITFRSISIPVILTLLIQGAIWVTMAGNVITSTPIFFICYLVIMCIQMGATVDYAILMTSKYKEARKTMNLSDSVDFAFHGALPTILTSGSILVLAAFIVGSVSNVSIISSLGMILARGCLISLLFITFALPQILFLCDKLIVKTTYGMKKSIEVQKLLDKKSEGLSDQE